MIISSYKYSIRERLLFQATDLQIKKGQIVHLTGESGAGKTLFSLGLLGLVPEEAHVELELTTALEMKPIHQFRAEDGFICFQQPHAYFHPAVRMGAQLIVQDASQYTYNQDQINTILKAMELPNSTDLFSKYPSELSVGQLQRCMIFSGLMKKPKLFILDEPFANLELALSQKIAALIKEYAEQHQAYVICISHDHQVMDGVSSETWSIKDERVKPIRLETAKLKPITMVHTPPKEKEIIATGSELSVQYNKIVPGKGIEKKLDTILKNVDFHINSGDRIMLFGPSGSGKSTLAKLICGLLRPSTGSLNPDNNIWKAIWKWQSSDFQLVFQEPLAAFNQKQPLKNQINVVDDALLQSSLHALGISKDLLEHKAAQLSGGELQRIALAAALQFKPSILVMDEALSAVPEDQGTIILDYLNTNFHQMAILFITHRKAKYLPYVSRFWKVDNRILTELEGPELV